MTLVRKLLILSATLLLVAILPLPIEFYMPLRIVVCGSAAYSAYYFFDKGQSQQGIILALIAVLWNPILPIYLGKAMWIPFDIAAVAYIVFLLRKS